MRALWSARSTPAGLACPLPALKTRLAAREMAPGDVLVVLATDPEAPSTWRPSPATGLRVRARREPDGWRLRCSSLTAKPPRRGSPAPSRPRAERRTACTPPKKRLRAPEGATSRRAAAHAGLGVDHPRLDVQPRRVDRVADVHADGRGR
jgi:TusA-related sulfurtransferase